MSQKSRKVCIVSDSSEKSEARSYSTHERNVYSVPNSNYETSYETYSQQPLNNNNNSYANNNSSEEVDVQQNVSSLLIFFVLNQIKQVQSLRCQRLHLNTRLLDDSSLSWFIQFDYLTVILRRQVLILFMGLQYS